MSHDKHSRGEDSTRKAELAALVEATLGRPLSAQKFSQLAAIQKRLHQVQDDLVAMMDAGSLDEKTYLERLKIVVRRAMAESKELLGEEDFLAIFGAAGENQDGLLEGDEARDPD